jgi:Xaa-Pro aminopeptidase
MKSDLDRLMQARGLQAFLVAGDESPNPIRNYMTNGAHITGGIVLKKLGAQPVLVVGSMETEEAAKSGLSVHTYWDFGYADLLQAAEGNRTKAQIGLWGNLLRAYDVPPGKIGLYGVGDLSVYLEFMKLVSKAYPDYEFVGELGTTLFDEAFLTKDDDEIERLKSVAVRTSEVLRLTWEYISSHRPESDDPHAAVVSEDGVPLTIGDVKRFVRRALLDRELEDTGMIFAQGRDAGYPHSRGEDGDALRLGQSIVFDLFPREIGGGYFHDCTRTWSIGYATPEVQAAYDQVKRAFDMAIDEFEVGMPASAMQEVVLNHFESLGHATGRSQPGTMNGYVHSLGHGVGLNIHESPSLSHLSKDMLQHGNVISIEPGLYYPEQGFGVRIEDLCYIDSQGQLVSMTDFHQGLVLPLRGAL